MFNLPLREKVLLIICAVGILTLGISLLRWFCREVYPSGSLRTLLTALCGALQPNKTLPDNIDNLVHRQLMDQKVRHLQVSMRVLSMVGLFWSSNFISEMLRREPRIQEVSTIAFSTMIGVHLVLSVGGCFPQLVTHGTLDVFYCLIALGFTVVVSPMAVSETDIMAPILLFNGGMALLNGARRTIPGRRLPVFAILNGLFCLSSASSIFLYAPALTSRPQMLALFQVLVGVCVCLFMARLERGTQTTMKIDMQLREVKELMEVACKLLRSCCQVVVETDGDGVITSEDTDLSSFLLRGGGHKSLKGTALAELLEPEDREPFLLRLRETQVQQTGLVESLPVSMRDGCGNLLRLSLLWLSFSRADGQYCMVGVREMADGLEQPLRAPGPAATAPVTVDVHVHAHTEPSARPHATLGEPGPRPNPPAIRTPVARDGLSDLPSRRSKGSPRSSRSSSSLDGDALAHAAARSFDDSAAFMVVDCTEPHFPVRLATCGFGLRVARLAHNSAFDSLVVDVANFTVWLHDSLNAIAYDLRPASDRCVELKVGRRRLKAECRVISFMPHTSDTGMPLNTQHVGLFFFNVRRIHRRGPSSTASEAQMVTL